MAKSGPIIILDDDADDENVLESVLRELKLDNKLIWFSRSDDALQYLLSTKEQPFIIFSDINLPGQNGIEFKRVLDNDIKLRRKSIPFIFYSTSADPWAVNEAYTKMTVQGFFLKHGNYEDIRNTVKIIVEYWQACRHPNAE